MTTLAPDRHHRHPAVRHRGILRLLAALVLAAASGVFGFVGAGPVSADPPDRLDLCHRDLASGTYAPRRVPVTAVGAHVGHGDLEPGAPVPGMDGYVFGADCSPQNLARAACLMTGWMMFIRTDGSNPQLALDGIPVYSDDQCTVFSHTAFDAQAFVWAPTWEVADALCASVGLTHQGFLLLVRELHYCIW